MSTAAHAIADVADFANPNVVKVVLDAAGRALYFTRAPIPWWRDARSGASRRRQRAGALRHVGIYAYRAGFLRRFPLLARSPLEDDRALEQLRVLWHGQRIAVHVSDEDARRRRRHARRTWSACARAVRGRARGAGFA